MPLNVLKFATNACINSLPTNDNLLRWGKKLNNKCDLCGSIGTLHHVLNSCSEMLSRYTWRHNTILSYLMSVLKEGDSYQKDQFKLYADLENHTIAGGTIPPNVLPSQQIPDMVLHWTNNKKLTLVELTVPFELNIDAANKRKVGRYASLVNDLKSNDISVDLCIFEIGSRGLITKQNQSKLKFLLKSTGCKISSKTVLTNISKLSLLGSYSIFNSRKDPNWNVNCYLKI